MPNVGRRMANGTYEPTQPGGFPELFTSDKIIGADFHIYKDLELQFLGTAIGTAGSLHFIPSDADDEAQAEE